MCEDRVLKFPTSEKVFHNINMLSWFILAVSGVAVYFKLVGESGASLLMDIHIIAAVISTVNFFGFAIINADRFILLLKNLTTWDRDTLAWFKNLGGYPRKLFGINFGPVEVAPQGKFNAGQKALYPLLIFMIFALIVSGWLLYAFTPALGKQSVVYIFNFHIWGSIVATVLVVFGHATMAFLNKEELKAMFRFGAGDIPLEDAKLHSPKWVENDLMKVEE
ncbi:MAG: cytochrome b/b6 domain-containing protein [Campylobacteraceae bacterium]|jgi:formate dehydrogenase subunit gamma|nr:cytochrome b/b6 domain-containing protein [Campylobacteraceae bacterium]